MPENDFSAAVEEWLKDEPSRTRRWLNAYLALYHNRLPREFRFFGVTHWTTKTAMASSAPAVAAFYGSIAVGTAAVAAAAIFLGNAFVGGLDRLSKDRSSKSSNGQSEIFIRFGDLLNALRSNATAATNRDDAIRACLGILEIFSREITKAGKGDVAVSLALYVGQSTARMRIKHRNPGNERPVGREFDCRQLLGHHACQADGLPRTVDDLKRFGREGATSPTQSKVNYRSLFIIPLESKKGSGKCFRGFVSIDSKKPYAFYGNRAGAIIVTCEPVISHLSDLI